MYKGIIAGVIILPLIVVVVILSVFGYTMLFSGEQKTEEEIFSTVSLDTSIQEETTVPIQEEINDEQPTDTDRYNPFIVKEISRYGDYKIIEMYKNNESWEIAKKVVFEIPVDWEGDSSVFAASPEPYTMKVDIGSVVNATRESALERYQEEGNIINKLDYNRMISENIYFTDQYEVFYRKHFSDWGPPCVIHSYQLYVNEECFSLYGYVFIDDLPEYDIIFKRIAESVLFQF